MSCAEAQWSFKEDEVAIILVTRRTQALRSRSTLCSHIRITRQPRQRKSRPTFRSRALLASSFASQKERLEDGFLPCNGHPCQKHPSTNTAILSTGNTKSGLTDEPDPREIRLCLRHPRTCSRLNAPAIACSVDRLPRERTADMTCERFSLDQMSMRETPSFAGIS